MAQINFSASTDDVERIDTLATSAGLSRSGLIREALAFYAARTTREDSERVKRFIAHAFRLDDVLEITSSGITVTHPEGGSPLTDTEALSALRVESVRGRTTEHLHLVHVHEGWRIYVGDIPAVAEVAEALRLPQPAIVIPAHVLPVAARFSQPQFTYPTD
jgi:predicted transcriptional regulator